MSRMKILAFGVICLSLGACGVSETATTAAAVAKSEAEQAKQAKQQMDKMQQQLDAANKQAADRLEAADSEAQ